VDIEELRQKLRKEGYLDSEIDTALQEQGLQPKSSSVLEGILGLAAPRTANLSTYVERGIPSASQTGVGQILPSPKFVGDTLGAAGELASYALPFGKAKILSKLPFGGFQPTGLLSKLPIRLGAAGAIHGATTPSESLPERIRSTAIEGGVGAATGLALSGLGKVLHPFKTVGEKRSGLAIKSEQTVSGDRLLTDLESKKQVISPTQQVSYNKFLKNAKKLYKNQEIPMTKALEILEQANKAFTAAGKVGKSATATFNKTLGDALRKEFAEKAPDIAKTNKLFEKLYTGQNIAKRLFFPAATGVATGATLGALFKLLGLGGSRNQ